MAVTQLRNSLPTRNRNKSSPTNPTYSERRETISQPDDPVLQERQADSPIEASRMRRLSQNLRNQAEMIRREVAQMFHAQRLLDESPPLYEAVSRRI